MKVYFDIVLVILWALNIKISNCTNPSRPNTELYDAFYQFLKFSPMLLGDNFTSEDEAEFAAGQKNQEVHLSIEKIIAKYGYPVERYKVKTEDGYILKLFRIRGAGSPVFLMHGLMESADDWVTPGPESGLSYLLAAAGYDVWMGNARGSKHSRHHVSLSPESTEFWDFSWDEIGRYDLPAMIDFILHSTSSHRLFYVGHSQGTTAFFVMASERPRYNEKIAFMVALAPAADIAHFTSPILQAVNYGTLLHPSQLFAVLRKYGYNKLAAYNPILKAISTSICGRSKIAEALCENTVDLIAGFNYHQLNFSTLPVILSHITSEVSVKQLEHYAQTLTYQRFQRFDYGATRNKVLYGSVTPPEYNVGSITTPMVFFYSTNDWLSTEIDVNILSNKMKNVTLYRVPDNNFTHLDFVLAKDLRKLIFTPILKILKTINYR